MERIKMTNIINTNYTDISVQKQIWGDLEMVFKKKNQTESSVWGWSQMKSKNRCDKLYGGFLRESHTEPSTYGICRLMVASDQQ